MLSLTSDDGWNNAIIPGGTPKGFKAIQERLLEFGLVAYSNRNTYIFLTASNEWSVFVSPEAQIQLCSIVGSDNASVNYLSASVPYVKYLEKHATRVSSIPVSICIGTRRLLISLDTESSTIRLSKCRSVLNIRDDIDIRVAEFCVMPCMFHDYPEVWSPGGPERIFKHLQVLFLDPLELSTLLWIIGNIVVDPSSVSKFLLLYGPGGTGKSTVISVIEDLLKGCCGTIRSSTLTDVRQVISIDTAKTIASNRVLTAGDIDLEVNKLNLHTVKELTGHDSISVPPLKVATHCSLIAACNDLPHVGDQKSWASSAISRRMVVLVMNVKTALLPKKPRPDEVEDNLDFLMLCVYAYLSNSSMPISIRCLLYTLLGNAYNEIAEKIEITDNATIQEVFDTNTAIEIFFSLPLHTLGELASLVSQSTVVTYGNVNFIKGIRLKEKLSE